MGAGARQQRRAGIDKQTINDVEEYGIAKLLDELEATSRTQMRPLRPAGCSFRSSQTNGAKAIVDPRGP